MLPHTSAPSPSARDASQHAVLASRPRTPLRDGDNTWRVGADQAVGRVANWVEIERRAGIDRAQLARDLGISRTPLREALNRRAAEGFVTFQPGRGFLSQIPRSRRHPRSPRSAAGGRERGGAAGGGAGPRPRHRRCQGLPPAKRGAVPGASPASVLVELDDEFHLRMIGLSGNRELERTRRSMRRSRRSRQKPRRPMSPGTRSMVR